MALLREGRSQPFGVVREGHSVLLFQKLGFQVGFAPRADEDFVQLPPLHRVTDLQMPSVFPSWLWCVAQVTSAVC